MPYVAPLTSLSALRTDSGELTIPSGGSVSWTHGLGATPSAFGAYAVCKNTADGYALGDQIVLDTAYRDGSNNWATYANSTVMKLVVTGNIFGANATGSGSAAFSNPNYKIVLWAIP